MKAGSENEKERQREFCYYGGKGSPDIVASLKGLCLIHLQLLS